MSDASPEASRGSLSRDTVHDLLADERRRTMLACLDEHGPLVLPDLADEVARAEHDSPLPQIPDDDVLCIYLSLWHRHVPKLSEAAVVAYDQDRDLVALGENAAQVAAFTTIDLPTGKGVT